MTESATQKSEHVLTGFFRRATPLTDPQVKALMIGGGAFIAVTVAIFRCYNDWKETLDYLSYVCPCLAAVVAGGAFYMGDRSKDKSYFFWSLVLLVCGLVAYANAHKNAQPFLLVSVLSAVVFCWAGFIAFVGLNWSSFDGRGKTGRVLLIVALAWQLVVISLIADHVHLFDSLPDSPSPCSLPACREPAHNQGANQQKGQQPIKRVHDPVGNVP